MKIVAILLISMLAACACMPKDAKLSAMDQQLLKQRNLVGDLKCSICEMAMNFIDKELSKESTKEKIIEVVGKVCDLFPDNIQPLCDSLIKDYGPAIIDDLVKKLDPATICADLKLCDSFGKVPKIVENDDESRYLFELFQKQYGKTYTSQSEHDKRFSIFKANLQKMAEMNKDLETSVYGITRFMDMAPEEFRTQFLGSKIPENEVKKDTVKVQLSDPPKSIDWRTKGAVTDVKDQEQCGSCWAFSATEAIESQWFMAGNPLPILAPQQIVDCDQEDYGCGGGWPTSAYDYVTQAGGQEGETSYPYVGRDQSCSFDKSKVVAQVKSFDYIAQGASDENNMVNALATRGPLSICVDAETWQYYSGGIITDNCGTSLDHCVELVGYDTDSSTGTDYWLVRNSWNTSWGESGYIRIERGKNLCGVAEKTTVPVVA